MATVARAVITGKRQNNHTMITADRAKIAQSAAMFERACDESNIPSPNPFASLVLYFIQLMSLNGHTVKTPRNP